MIICFDAFSLYCVFSRWWYEKLIDKGGGHLAITLHNFCQVAKLIYNQISRGNLIYFEVQWALHTKSLHNDLWFYYHFLRGVYS